MTTKAEKSLSWLRSYWNNQPPAEIAKSEIQLFSKEVNKLTIGEFYSGYYPKVTSLKIRILNNAAT